MDGNGNISISIKREKSRTCRLCGKPCWYSSVHKRCKDQREEEERARKVCNFAVNPIFREPTVRRRLTKAPRRK